VPALFRDAGVVLAQFVEGSMRSVTFFFTGILLSAAMVQGAAFGADKSPDAVRAESLFEEARRLMVAGDLAGACPKFAESNSLDPAPGTALNLATCYEKAGKLASAWAAYRTAEASATSARQKDRAALAKKKAAALQPKLSRLTVQVPAHSQVAGLTVRCEGEPIQSPEWGVPIARDGGKYAIEASAPGKKAWTSQVELQASGQNLTVEIPALEDAPQPVAQTAPQAPPNATTVDTTMATPPPSKGEQRGGTQRTVGIVVGGVGIAGLGAAGVLGLVAKSQFDNAKKDASPLQPSQKAMRTGDIATGFAIGGGALLATGLTLWLTAPRGSVTVGTNGTELLVTGKF
jgi:hypothetical protein